MDKIAGGNGVTHFKNAKAGNIFLVTKKGYEKTPDKVKKKRKIGSPVKGFEYSVSASWIDKGYVKEYREAQLNFDGGRNYGY